MVSNPLKSVAELKNWKSNADYLNKSRIPFIDSQKGSEEYQTLICHDLKGGYLEDRFRFGCKSDDTYRFWNWWQIDIFVYFSHNFVTIPPTGWVEAAHKHRCKILGTIITEFDEGELICGEILTNDETIEILVTTLVEVSQYYGFDGWLLNIENKLDVKLISKLEKFVSILTDKMHENDSNSLVIWYDSITIDGELLWQDELNLKNKNFFNFCDGIYLNYCWTIEKLCNSRLLAEQRNFDIFVGIDVFGRGCVGGFDSINSIEKIIENELSVAIFGQSWTYECFQIDNYIENETKFWRLLEKSKTQRKLRIYPFKSYFCQGAGQFYCINGQKISSDAWSNLSLQELQPFYSSCISVCLQDAYLGASCIQVTSCNDTNSTYKLFYCDFSINKQFLITIVYKFVTKPLESNICLSCIEDTSNVLYSFPLLLNSPQKNNTILRQHSVLSMPSHEPNTNLRNDEVLVSIEEDSSNAFGWMKRTFVLTGIKPATVNEISLGINGANNSSLLLGYLKMSPNVIDEYSFLSFKFNLLMKPSSIDVMQVDVSSKYTSHHIADYLKKNLKVLLPIQIDKSNIAFEDTIDENIVITADNLNDDLASVNRVHLFVLEGKESDDWSFKIFSPLLHFSLPWTPSSSNIMKIKLDLFLN